MNGETQQAFNKYKFQYKLFLILGTLVLLEEVFQVLGIPFIAALFLYPILNLFFTQETIYGIIGFYSITWILFYMIAFSLHKKIKEIQERETSRTQVQTQDKESNDS